MKILHYIPSMNPIHGGPPNLITTLAVGLIKKGHDVEIATTELDKDFTAYWKSLSDKNVKISNFKLIRPRRMRFSTNLIKYLRANHDMYECIHIHSIWDLTAVNLINIAKKNQIKVIFSTHGYLDPYSLRRNKLKKLLFRHIFKLNSKLKMCNTIICGSQAEKANLEREFGKKNNIKILENTIRETPLIKNEDFIWKQIHQVFNKLPRNEKFILITSRLDDKKSIKEQIEAFDIAKKQNMDGNLVILGLRGDPGYYEEITKQIQHSEFKDNIYLTTCVTGDLQYPFLQSATIVSQVSKQEGFSLSILNALYCGRRIIASTESNMNKLVDDEIIKVSAVDPREIAFNFINLINETVEQRLYAENAARRYYLKYFSNEAIIGKLEELYTSA